MSEGYKIQPESTGGNIRVTSMWVNSANVLQQGVSIADPTSGWQMQVNSAGGGLMEIENIGVVSSLYSRLARIESWSFVSDGALVMAVSIPALAGGQSQALAISSTSNVSSAITAGRATILPTVDCFFRAGVAPTALSDGTDDFLVANNKYRVGGITSGHKLAFKTVAASGTVYITPGG